MNKIHEALVRSQGYGPINSAAISEIIEQYQSFLKSNNPEDSCDDSSVLDTSSASATSVSMGDSDNSSDQE